MAIVILSLNPQDTHHRQPLPLPSPTHRHARVDMVVTLTAYVHGDKQPELVQRGIHVMARRRTVDRQPAAKHPAVPTSSHPT